MGRGLRPTLRGGGGMNRMPCSITDDPYCDASDFYEKKGVYKEKPNEDKDEHDENDDE